MVAGGVLVLVTPANWPTAASPDYSSLSSWPLTFSQLSFHFDTRLARLITAYQPPTFNEHQPLAAWQEFLNNFTANQPPPKNLPATSCKSYKPYKEEPLLYGALTPCQSKAVSQLLTWFSQKKPQPLVITANRGRGKSGALGLFVRQLLTGQTAANPPLSIIITAPSPAATQAIMQRLEDLPAASLAAVHFIAPDALLAELPPANLLLIDEAAALPVPLLKALVQAYPASVFATTQAGYEGNGRGFALRFNQYLTANYPQLMQLELHQPLRWAANCPLEALINQLLLLDADLPSPATQLPNQPLINNEANKLSFSWLSQAELAANESLLEKIMALLVLAHYRTSPNNLRQLLDAPKQRLLVAWLNSQPVGLVLVQTEGGFPADLAEQIYLGQRRPQGHLLAQSLAFHAGFTSAATASYWRVQRVLVHPSLHRQGLGSQLLTQLEIAAKNETGLDFLGTSFGATPELASFWFRLGYLPVRLGLTANQASGEHTLQLVKSLGKKPKQLAQALNLRFAQVFINSLGFNFNQLNPNLALSLLQASQLKAAALTPADSQELKAFCQGARPLVLSHTAIKNWLLNNLHQPNTHFLQAVLQVCLQNKTPAALQKQLGLKGKKQLDKYFKKELKELINFNSY